MEADIAQELAFRFAVVLALAVIILVIMTLVAPQSPANNKAVAVPSSDAIYRPQHLLVY